MLFVNYEDPLEMSAFISGMRHAAKICRISTQTSPDITIDRTADYLDVLLNNKVCCQLHEGVLDDKF